MSQNLQRWEIAMEAGDGGAHSCRDPSTLPVLPCDVGGRDAAAQNSRQRGEGHQAERTHAHLDLAPSAHPHLHILGAFLLLLPGRLPWSKFRLLFRRPLRTATKCTARPWQSASFRC